MASKADTFLCFAHGTTDGWEAICVDLDVSAQADTFEDVQVALHEAIDLYVECAMEEAPAVRDALLQRRAPFWVRLNLTAKLVAYNVFRGRGREAQASFPVACPA